jgi:hypothetical protein
MQELHFSIFRLFDFLMAKHARVPPLFLDKLTTTNVKAMTYYSYDHKIKWS